MKLSTALKAALAGAVFMAASGANAATEIKAAHYLAPKHPLGWGYEVLRDWLAKETNGKIKIQVFAGESLLAAKALSDGVRDGVADVAPLVMTYTPSYYPHAMMFSDLAMFGRNDTAAAFAMSELWTMNCPGCQDDARAQNQIAMSGFSTTEYVLVGKGPMNTLATLKGKKLRSGGPLWARFAERVGAVAVNIPSGEIYEGLSRGILDAAIYGRNGLKTFGLADVTDTVSEVPLGSFRATVYQSFNIEKWKSMSAEDRGWFLKGIPHAVVAMLRKYRDDEQESIEYGKSKGIKFLKPDAELQKVLDDFVAEETSATIKRWVDKGLKDAPEFVAKYKELYGKFEPMVTPVMDDDAKLAQILWTEVYSKLDPKTFGLN